MRSSRRILLLAWAISLGFGLHLVWQETKYSTQQPFSTVPKVVDLITDPREERNVVEPYNTWVQYPGTKLLVDFKQSVMKYPNVPLGAPDSYSPSR